MSPKSPVSIERLFWVSGWIYDFSKIATIFLIIGLVAHYFFFTVLVVRGKSMEPSYEDGQVLLIDRVNYRFQSPQRGDVVAMYFPGETERRFLKRLVGLPGETIAIKGSKVLIDGVALDEAYLPEATVTSPDLERKLQANEYFVLGDNRSVSSDSRAWGPVPKSFLAGKVRQPLLSLPQSNAAAH